MSDQLREDEHIVYQIKIQIFLNQCINIQEKLSIPKNLLKSRLITDFAVFFKAIYEKIYELGVFDLLKDD